MAIKKAIEIRDTGVTAEYLMIETFQYLKDSNQLLINLAVYKDVASREANKSCIEYVVVSLADANTLALAGANIVTMLYNKLKNLPEFSGAVDV